MLTEHLQTREQVQQHPVATWWLGTKTPVGTKMPVLTRQRGTKMPVLTQQRGTKMPVQKQEHMTQSPNKYFIFIIK